MDEWIGITGARKDGLRCVVCLELGLVVLVGRCDGRGNVG